jgi:cell division protein ZapA
MAEKVKTIVRIAGREYAIRGNESEEYIHKGAIHVNRIMEEVINRQPGLSTAMAAVLTAINLADESLKLRKEMEILQERIKELEETMESMKVETAVSAIEQNPKPPAIYDVSRKGKR